MNQTLMELRFLDKIGKNVTYSNFDNQVLWVAAGRGGQETDNSLLWSNNGKTWNKSNVPGISFLRGSGVTSSFPLYSMEKDKY